MILFRGAETHTRSVVKAISWRTLGTFDTNLGGDPLGSALIIVVAGANPAVR